MCGFVTTICGKNCRSMSLRARRFGSCNMQRSSAAKDYIYSKDQERTAVSDIMHTGVSGSQGVVSMRCMIFRDSEAGALG